MDFDVADNGYHARITRLERRVSQLEHNIRILSRVGDINSSAAVEAQLKSQAAQTQATEHLYAPLRNDVKAITELSAFVRKIAMSLHPTSDMPKEAQALLNRLQK